LGAEKICAIIVENVSVAEVEGAEFTVSVSFTVGEGDSAESYKATFTGTIPPEACA
jgi:hypothetical protein